MAIGAMIENSLVAAVVSNPRLADNPIVACNQAFIDLTGYSESEIIGRNCRFLRGPETEAQLTEQLRAGIAARVPVMVEILNYKKGGVPFRNAVMIAPIFDAEGEIEYFLGSQVELSPGVHEGQMSRASIARDKVESLPKRQREILECIAAGKLNKQIAWELQLSERTVKLHRAAVLKALGVRTSADAIRMAIEAGL
ncbi:LuxR C-terminal-related transcriptional regulator [Novosphingobium sp. Fuku2-ISO-50]|uniref:LuxR C-terminal-related transcriptional regulator n=1 Tax=Novosphingobium sp. Fuku2-ISO-50 TaxID=1739114 RepID=UPI00076C128F|nr:LuxR C-terminal-related transcriptional regulator [Novosphingobium sp. Fuku2-ISO-50]KUR73340.1 histidine kinase [Novosphingobium sp. Fuku2-ISO-50]